MGYRAPSPGNGDEAWRLTVAKTARHRMAVVIMTRYIATVMHPDKATKDRHQEMGFFDGWNTCIDQLEAFAQQSR
jgi:uncharacterized protein YndB with AHSA1/START domain